MELLEFAGADSSIELAFVWPPPLGGSSPPLF